MVDNRKAVLSRQLDLEERSLQAIKGKIPGIEWELDHKILHYRIELLNSDSKNLNYHLSELEQTINSLEQILQLMRPQLPLPIQITQFLKQQRQIIHKDYAMIAASLGVIVAKSILAVSHLSQQKIINSSYSNKKDLEIFMAMRNRQLLLEELTTAETELIEKIAVISQLQQQAMVRVLTPDEQAQIDELGYLTRILQLNALRRDILIDPDIWIDITAKNTHSMLAKMSKIKSLLNTSLTMLESYTTKLNQWMRTHLPKSEAREKEILTQAFNMQFRTITFSCLGLENGEEKTETPHLAISTPAIKDEWQHNLDSFLAQTAEWIPTYIMPLTK